MSISVGSIQKYVPGSTWFDLARYNNLATKERVSINLSSSNLWLIDSSQLRLEETYAPRIAFINEGAGYQSILKISSQGATTGEAVVFNNVSAYDSILPNSTGPLYRGDCY